VWHVDRSQWIGHLPVSKGGERAGAERGGRLLACLGEFDGVGAHAAGGAREGAGGGPPSLSSSSALISSGAPGSQRMGGFCATRAPACLGGINNYNNNSAVNEGVFPLKTKGASLWVLNNVCDRPFLILHSSFSFFTLISFVRIKYSSSDEYVTNEALSPQKNFPIFPL